MKRWIEREGFGWMDEGMEGGREGETGHAP